MFTRALKVMGMVPNSWFSAISKCCSDVMVPKEEGIDPNEER